MMHATAPRVPESADEIIRERKKRILSVKSLALFCLSAFLVYFLLNRLDIARTIEAFRGASFSLLGLSSLLYALSNLFRSIRFGVLLGDARVGGMDLFAITGYHNFFNQVLPARTGELTFVYYLKRIGGVDISKGLHALLVARVFDFIIVAAFFVCSIIIHYGWRTSMLLAGTGIFFFIVSIVSLFYLKWIVIASRVVFERAMRLVRLREKPLVKNVLSKVAEVEDEFAGFDTRRFIPALAFTSLLVWSALYLFSYVTINAFGVDMNFMQSVAGATGAVLVNVLPINSFGSFGTLEAGWTGGFVLVGMSEQDAITTGLASHILNIAAAAAIALVCAAALRLRRKP